MELVLLLLPSLRDSENSISSEKEVKGNTVPSVGMINFQQLSFAPGNI
jgi:hypothetical protein